MGVIKRQGIASGILMNVGVIIGFINAGLIFPNVMGKTYYGFIQWMESLIPLILMFSTLGVKKIVVRFFPYFKDREKGHNGFLPFLLLVMAIGTGIGVIVFFGFKDVFLEHLVPEKNLKLVRQFYYLLPVLLVFIGFKDLMGNYVSALLKPRVSVFLNQIVERLFVMSLLLFVYFNFIDPDLFLNLYVLKYALSFVCLVWFVKSAGELFLQWDFRFMKKPVFKEMKSFTGFTLLGGISGQVINKIDIIMIGSMESLANAGIYAPFNYAARFIVLPHHGLNKITNPIIANAWKNNNTEQIEHLYKRTALNNLAVGLLLFAGIWVNIDHFVNLLPPAYAAGKNVALFLGIAQLVSVANGYNTLVINHSKKYKFLLFTKIFTSVFTIAANLVLIKMYGIVGAAVATALTLIVINLINQSFVYFNFKMHPFQRKTIWLILSMLVALAAGIYMPVIEFHWIADIIIRSGVITLVYILPIYFFNLAPDIVEGAVKTIRKYRKRLLG